MRLLLSARCNGDRILTSTIYYTEVVRIIAVISVHDVRILHPQFNDVIFQLVGVNEADLVYAYAVAQVFGFRPPSFTDR